MAATVASGCSRKLFGHAVNLDASRSPIDLITLDNGYIRVELISLGAAIRSLVAPDKHGERGDVILGFDEAAGYLADHDGNPYMGATVGRFANRILGGKFNMPNGQEVTLPANENGENTLHGGYQAFDRAVWKVSTEADERKVVFTHFSPDGDNGFPGDVLVNVSYEIAPDSAELIMQYKALCSAPTVLNLTNHSYFNLAGHGSGPEALKEHAVAINASKALEVDADLLPTGQIINIKDSPLDFTTLRKIGDSLALLDTNLAGFDHNFCLEADDVNFLPVTGGANDDISATTSDLHMCKLAARVEHEPSGRVLEVRTTQPGVQFYTANNLPEGSALAGKGAEMYQKHGAFCLETQGYPNAPNCPQFPTTVIYPGNLYEQTTSYAFGLKQ